MAAKKNTYRNSYKKKRTEKSKVSSPGKNIKFDLEFLGDRRFKVSLGLLLLFFSLFLFLSLLSYIFTGKADQSVVESTGFGALIVSGKEVQNWLGLAGAGLAHLFIYQWFGIASVLLVPLVFAMGYKIVFNKEIIPLVKSSKVILFLMFWISLLFGYIVQISEEPGALHFLCGGIGLGAAEIFDSLVGWGTLFFLVFSMGVFSIYFIRKEILADFQESIQGKRRTKPEEKTEAEMADDEVDQEDKVEEDNGIEAGQEMALTIKPPTLPSQMKKQNTEPDFSVEDKTQSEDLVVESKELGPSLEIEKTNKNEGEQLVIEDMDQYDPKLDLSRYQYPSIELLSDGGTGKVKVTTEELQSNKEKIVETLSNFKINISSIKATIGPTVTLYEIVPEAGVKISRIKNLEDDIALSLAALGIRIIAPIPGKGTIGIEVPNKNRETVSIKSVLATGRFMNSGKELPIALGKTISNEVFITDLTKMPHLLMAGATGQGKSVGLNVILTSLLYKKHPSQLKFVLVDPKKVELNLFNKIERHFLASLPDAEDAIVTDTRKVVNVLNSLCIEMDVRYNLLKEAGCRNLKEYNRKFVNRKLNPEKGHRFLPYIVLVIDELADLMMVAGKEVEMPIARLAQLARAIGIHLIIATQRPSVDVITGIIKANFPARLSFKVSSKIDSRTILDTGGADQLIGMGDMLLSNGSEIIRLQCAFVDTDEVEKVCAFIGDQQGYDTAYLLPEAEDESAESKALDLKSRDAMFEEAARLIVTHQQGSTSLVQRKLSLGYNRAGRIIDQLEAAGIVGPFEGSKARQVLIMDTEHLEEILRNMP
ncbi:FtsK/SpoIIIE family DNA translocase [Flexithrix dorotheae]|uniref:FtsK/SpoIIIE family DNA translocase n=1 Tax=Flexithrix dorotheae TaxID=70993 RepID=UPI000364FBA9|nr:DNA translocase FtsK [Flexithrix dorotheae]